MRVDLPTLIAIVLISAFSLGIGTARADHDSPRTLGDQLEAEQNQADFDFYGESAKGAFALLGTGYCGKRAFSRGRGPVKRLGAFACSVLGIMATGHAGLGMGEAALSGLAAEYEQKQLIAAYFAMAQVMEDLGRQHDRLEPALQAVQGKISYYADIAEDLMEGIPLAEVLRSHDYHVKKFPLRGKNFEILPTPLQRELVNFNQQVAI